MYVLESGDVDVISPELYHDLGMDSSGYDDELLEGLEDVRLNYPLEIRTENNIEDDGSTITILLQYGGGNEFLELLVDEYYVVISGTLEYHESGLHVVGELTIKDIEVIERFFFLELL